METTKQIDKVVAGGLRKMQARILIQMGMDIATSDEPAESIIKRHVAKSKARKPLHDTRNGASVAAEPQAQYSGSGK